MLGMSHARSRLIVAQSLPKRVTTEIMPRHSVDSLDRLNERKKKRLLLRHFQGQTESLPLTHIEKMSFRSILVELASVLQNDI